MVIKTWRNPYENGSNLTAPREIELKEGVTVLVGCNGSGKTTLISNIKEELEKQNIPVCLFDNINFNSNSSALSIICGYNAFPTDTPSTGMSLFTASEGEAIKINIGRHSTLYRDFLKEGIFKDKHNDLLEILRHDKLKPITSNKRFLLFDATDSGLSIDAVLDVKNLFNIILDEAKTLNLECYIIISANEYELCDNQNCFDVNAGKYITFKNYNDYKKFILNSRKKKDKRIEKEIQYTIKKRERKKANAERKINTIKENATKANRNLTMNEKYTISKLEKEIKDLNNENY